MARTLSTLLGLGCLVLTGACQERYDARLATGDEVTVVRAIKGNDVVVKKGKDLARVRLVGAYAFDPASLEQRDIMHWAREARSAMEYATHGKTLRVVLEREELDPRGRHLGFLELDGQDLGLQLISSGAMAVYTEYPFSREAAYFAAEQKARAAELGLWGAPKAAERLRPLRSTWSAVRARESAAPADQLVEAGAP